LESFSPEGTAKGLEGPERSLEGLEGFVVERGPQGRLAIARHLAPALRGAGYGLDSDGRTRASGLAGRRPLLELATSDGNFLVKRFTHGGLLRFLTRDRFGDAERPFRELAVAARLVRAGVRTPEVAAARARRAPLLGWRLEILTRRIDGAVDLDTIAARVRGGEIDRWTAGRIAASFGRLVRAMHDAGCLHADLTTKNVLVVEASLASNRPETAILDLDRARIEASLPLEARSENLARLLRYVRKLARESGPAFTAADGVRFLAAYEPDRQVRRAYTRAILRAEAKGRARHGVGRALERLFG
jgi:tRNA A-37 threonylcarbamoyl transferase component Bud32